MRVKTVLVILVYQSWPFWINTQDILELDTGGVGLNLSKSAVIYRHLQPWCRHLTCPTRPYHNISMHIKSRLVEWMYTTYITFLMYNCLQKLNSWIKTNEISHHGQIPCEKQKTRITWNFVYGVNVMIGRFVLSHEQTSNR